MIQSIIFEKKLENGRIAFRGAIIERNIGYTLLVDTSIKRFDVYKNLFFRIVDGKFKIEFIDQASYNKSGRVNPAIFKIDKNNPFDNIKEYVQKDDTCLIQEFVLSPAKIVNNRIFFEKLHAIHCVDFIYKNLLNESCELVSACNEWNQTIEDLVNKIIELDYSKAVYELETIQKIDFDSLTSELMMYLSQVGNHLKHLLGIDGFDRRMAFQLANKCIQTTAYIPKNIEIDISNIDKKISEINQKNTSISDEEEYQISKVIQDVFKSENMDLMKFDFYENINNASTKKTLEIKKDNLEKNQLKKSIKEYEDKKRQSIKELTSEFFIDGVGGLANEERAIYYLIDKKTNTKYRKKILEGDTKNRGVLFSKLMQKKSFLAKITFVSISKNKDIESIEYS